MRDQVKITMSRSLALVFLRARGLLKSDFESGLLSSIVFAVRALQRSDLTTSSAGADMQPIYM
jgi:hypothetical protein